MTMECQRSEFSIPDDVHYLNCAYMGPLPVRSQEAGVAGIRRKAVPIDISPSDFFSESDEARSVFASIIGATEPQRVAILPSVSYGVAIVARNLPCPPGRRIIVAAEQFPSNVYAWRRLAEERGAELYTAIPPFSGSSSRGELWNEEILAAIDERTAIVALPHVHWTDGTRFDLERIGARAREYGASLVIDGTQSIGAMPIDIGRIQPDAVLCAGYKWLLGPYAVAFGWFSHRFDHGVPLEETWIGRERSEDFQRLIDYRDGYQPGSARYDVGERSNFILLPMALTSMKMVHDWGAADIQEYCDATFSAAIDEARDIGYSVEPREWRGSHLFGLRLPRWQPQEPLLKALKENRVHASMRGSALRVAPYVYNNEADAAALLQALRAAASDKPRPAGVFGR
jgi:selenocysteine lyase/cysteine desulfurase